MKISAHSKFLRFLFVLLVVFVLIDAILLFLVFNPQVFQSFLTRLSPTPKPGSCLILEEKYCKKVKLISDPSDTTGLLAAYRVPKGAVLFAPIGGFYSHTPTFFFVKDKATGEVVKYPGATITISKDNIAQTVSATYSFIYFKEKENLYFEIKKGEIIGYISDKAIDYLGDYNLIMRVTRQRFVDGKIVFENDPSQLRRVLNIK